MATPLPEWALRIKPVDMDGAAEVLGICRRTLVDVLKKHPHYEPRGSKKVFYPEHIEALREAMTCRTSNPSGRTMASSTPLEPSTESAYERALGLATQREPRNSAPS